MRWDQTSGTNGGLASTASNGGSKAFSTATDTASLTVEQLPPVEYHVTFLGWWKASLEGYPVNIWAIDKFGTAVGTHSRIGWYGRLCRSRDTLDFDRRACKDISSLDAPWLIWS